MTARNLKHDLNTYVVIPVKNLNRIKSRLSGHLSLDDRKRLNVLMLSDVLAAIRRVNEVRRVLIVTSDKEILAMAKRLGADSVPENGDFGVNQAVASGISAAERSDASSVLVLPSDIPLISPQDIRSIVSLQSQTGIVITPSTRFDGTNALLMNPPDVIPTFYDQQSFYSHLKAAVSEHAKISIYLSRKVMLDIDSKEDVEALRLANDKCESARFCRELNITLKAKKPRSE